MAVRISLPPLSQPPTLRPQARAVVVTAEEGTTAGVAAAKVVTVALVVTIRNNLLSPDNQRRPERTASVII